MDKKSRIAEFMNCCQEARKISLSFKNPLVVHHYDADGISSGSLVMGALKDAGKKGRNLCLSKLDDVGMEKIEKEKEIIFVDLGGGNKRVNELNDVVILDHHETEGIEKFQANPLLFGLDGSHEISSSGVAYFTFKSRVELGVVGAMGDMQYPMRGLNEIMVKEGAEKGEVKIENDLRFYGRYSRTLVNFLQYCDDPYIPGISYNEKGVLELLHQLNIPLKDDKWRRYVDLNEDEKKRLISAIANILIQTNRTKKAEELIGESYVFPNRKKQTYEANEFSTLLNACGRHGRADVGIKVCLQDINEEAVKLLAEHRKMIKEGIEYANKNIQDLGKFKFIDGRGIIDESIIGTVIGMTISYKWNKPIIGIASSKEKIKVSSRTPKHLLEKGLDLGQLMKKSCEEVGGIGGGHSIAAGASIPQNKLNEFLLAVGKQLDI